MEDLDISMVATTMDKRPSAQDTAKLHPEVRTQLKDYLLTHFNLSELYDISFDLGIDYQTFAHAPLQDFCRELILYLERRENLSCLVIEILRRRESNEIAQILCDLPPCQSRKKVQIILPNGKIDDVQNVLIELAKILDVSKDEIVLIAKRIGSLHLLLSLPDTALERLQELGLEVLLDSEYEVESITEFDLLDKESQKVWRSTVEKTQELQISDTSSNDETDDSIVREQVKEAIYKFVNSYDLKLINDQTFEERVIEVLSRGLINIPDRAVWYEYSLVLHTACSGVEGKVHREQGYLELLRFLRRRIAMRYPDIDAEETLQDTLVSILNKFNTCKEPHAFLAFSFQMLWSKIRKARKENRNNSERKIENDISYPEPNKNNEIYNNMSLSSSETDVRMLGGISENVPVGDEPTWNETTILTDGFFGFLEEMIQHETSEDDKTSDASFIEEQRDFLRELNLFN